MAKNDGGPAVIPQSEWKWFGSPGHFICAQWCRFHLCTQVGDYLISTIGEYVHPRHGRGNERQEAEWLAVNWPGEDIGYKRKYETMVFQAGEPCNMPGCNCGMPDQANGQELAFTGYKSRGEATAGHLAMCHRFADAMLAEREKEKGTTEP